MRYAGRPAPRVLEMCNGTADEGGACDDEDPPEVEVDDPTGFIAADDRLLVLADAKSPGEPDDLDDDGVDEDWDGLDDAGERYALTFSFRFEDEAGGSAPAGWNFLDAGPATYRSGMIDGTARFIIETALVEVERQTVGGADVWAPVAPASEVLLATPGRLEVLDVDDDAIEGRFFLTYESPTGQQQGQVNGCFSLDMAAPNSGLRLLSE